ncbi:hypothetical protein Pelo_13084 [Pelomyxa schiedti]|nr:hypothetical protein Pelo_13084 [Pelomyxa schiedti]
MSVYLLVVLKRFVVRAPLYLGGAAVVRAFSLMAWAAEGIHVMKTNDEMKSGLCWSTEITQFWSILSSSWWLLALCLFLFLAIVLKWEWGQRRFFNEVTFLIICTVVPLPIAVIIAVGKYYADLENWIWCSRFSRFEMVCVTLPVCISVILLCFTTYHVFHMKSERARKTYQMENSVQNASARKDLFGSLVAYPIIVAAVMTLQLILGIVQALSGTVVTASLDGILVTTTPLALSIAYLIAFRKNVRTGAQSFEARAKSLFGAAPATLTGYAILQQDTEEPQTKL